MIDYKYLIIGGGMTADAAVKGIRSLDPDGSIGIITAEQHSPYKRPSLSKGLWKGKPLEKIWLKTEDKNATLHLSTTAEKLDPAAKTVTDSTGTVFHYQKLLLATGGEPRRLPFGGESVIYFRTVDDYFKLRTLADTGQHFAVIGGGFIGSEIAAALRMVGKEAAIIFPEAGITARVFPVEVLEYLNDFFRQKGVEVFAGWMIKSVQPEGKKTRVTIHQPISGETCDLLVDGVVAGLGLILNTTLAEKAGLKVGNGIQVNELLQTSQPDIYAAGDVANYMDSLLQMRRRLEHEDQANTMGLAAGRNMAGANEPFTHTPYFFSDLFEFGYEAVGELDSNLQIIMDWEKPFDTGVIYYLRDGRVRGVLLWNVWGRLDEARELIAQPGPFNAENLKGMITSS